MVTTDVFEAPLMRSSDLGTRTLGRYRIERELGAGGMGVVYAAFDPGLERRVALKILGAHGGDSSRLVREARAMARLNHPNIITVHEVGQVAGRDYGTMELVDGGTLAEWLDGKPRSPREIVAAFLAAGRGLVAAHAVGIVHRDFKPHHVLRDRRASSSGFQARANIDGCRSAIVPRRAAGVALPVTQRRCARHARVHGAGNEPAINSARRPINSRSAWRCGSAA
jgi:hypothetical protein